MDLGALPTPAEMAELSGADLDRALVELESARRIVEAAYVAVLDRGRLAAYGPPEETLTPQLIASVWGVAARWLGEPGARALVTDP